MEKFEEQEMKKIRLNIRLWFDWFVKQNVIGKKPKNKRDKLKHKTINDTWTLFETKKEIESTMKEQIRIE